jgi:Kef-type K+ transport system membrane component KefB
MFLAGLEFEVDKVRNKIRSAIVIAALAVVIPGLLAFPVGYVLQSEVYSSSGLLPFALFLGSALSVTAFPVMAHILMERGELNSPLGGLGVAIAGIISVLMFGYIAFAGTIAADEGLVGFLINGLFIVLFILSAVLVVRPILRKVLPSQESGKKIDGTGIAVIFAGMLIFGLLGHVLRIHAMVGGFIWGLILPLSLEQRQEIASKIRDLALIAFLPIFFAMSGFATDLKQLTLATLPAIGLILFAAIAGKFGAAAFGRSFKLPWNDVGKLRGSSQYARITGSRCRPDRFAARNYYKSDVYNYRDRGTRHQFNDSTVIKLLFKEQTVHTGIRPTGKLCRLEQEDSSFFRNFEKWLIYFISC